MKPPKGLAVMLLSKHKADEGGDDMEGDEPEMPPGEEVAQEFLDAVKAGDAKAVWHAFRGMQACDEHAEDSEEAPEDEAE